MTTFFLWLRMTRPGFLIITVVACGLGFALAVASGHALRGVNTLATWLLALVVHAAANVLNDYHDGLNGADDANVDGIFPFTGGARLIQTGVVSLQETRRLALTLLLLAVPCGLALTWATGPGLLALGTVGLGLAWAYSVPPLALMTRGLGELVVGLVWALVVVGADYSVRGVFDAMPMGVSISYGLLIFNILLINGFPDAVADAQVGKRSLVVRWGPRRVALLYGVVAAFAHTWVALGWMWHLHPQGALWGLASAPVSALAAVLLWRHAEQAMVLKPAIVLTIVAAVVHGTAMAWGVYVAA